MLKKTQNKTKFLAGGWNTGGGSYGSANVFRSIRQILLLMFKARYGALA